MRGVDTHSLGIQLGTGWAVHDRPTLVLAQHQVEDDYEQGEWRQDRPWAGPQEAPPMRKSYLQAQGGPTATHLKMIFYLKIGCKIGRVTNITSFAHKRCIQKV